MFKPFDPVISISAQTQRRFILGQQGLWPGRRWRGKEGARRALQAGCVVQVDPLNVVARSHDIALHGRVASYQPALLDTLLYTERAGFDYGGTVVIHPIEDLPYWRVVMANKRLEPRRVKFAAEHAGVVAEVREAVQARGPLGTRDLDGRATHPGGYRSSKDTGQALYYLWLAGELMTHSRRGFERVYDLLERVAPPHLQAVASLEAAEDFFARQVFRDRGLVSQRGFRNFFMGNIERPVPPQEAEIRLKALLESGAVVPIHVETVPTGPVYLLAEDLPLLEALHEGQIPEGWRPVDTTTEEEVTLLAPLEIVSARGRAKPLFGFEYLWEVYKPAEKRRWGYYTLPVLYGDRLVARLDPRLERSTRTLVILGFWLEDSFKADGAFRAALRQGLERFMAFLGAESLRTVVEVPI